MSVIATDPPGWDRPNPKPPKDPNPVVCDRCGALVSDWQKHSDWHALLAGSDALVIAMIAGTGTVQRRDMTPEVRAAVDWATATAKANA